MFQLSDRPAEQYEKHYEIKDTDYLFTIVSKNTYSNKTNTYHNIEDFYCSDDNNRFVDKFLSSMIYGNKDDSDSNSRDIATYYRIYEIITLNNNKILFAFSENSECMENEIIVSCIFEDPDDSNLYFFKKEMMYSNNRSHTYFRENNLLLLQRNDISTEKIFCYIINIMAKFCDDFFRDKYRNIIAINFFESRYCLMPTIFPDRNFDDQVQSFLSQYEVFPGQSIIGIYIHDDEPYVDTDGFRVPFGLVVKTNELYRFYQLEYFLLLLPNNEKYGPSEIRDFIGYFMLPCLSSTETINNDVLYSSLMNKKNSKECFSLCDVIFAYDGTYDDYQYILKTFMKIIMQNFYSLTDDTGMYDDVVFMYLEEDDTRFDQFFDKPIIHYIIDALSQYFQKIFANSYTTDVPLSLLMNISLSELEDNISLIFQKLAYAIRKTQNIS